MEVDIIIRKIGFGEKRRRYGFQNAVKNNFICCYNIYVQPCNMPYLYP